MSRGGLPPRWKNCPRNGQLISGIFVPFKVPLSDAFNGQLPIGCQFTPKMFINFMKSQKIEIGLWIDLTNTDRFYDKDDVENEAIHYVKLKCRGFQECPSEEQTDLFITVCRKFLEKYPNRQIAVHCTHGFNRTGFLISSYLVKEHDWDIEAAVLEFAKAREPGIYKQEYIDELFRRFGDIENKLSAPQKPDWCLEDSQYNDDEADISNNGYSSGSTAISNTGSNPLDDIDGVVSLNNLDKVKSLQRMCSNMCKFRLRGFPGAQPVSLTRENLDLLQREEYMVSWKADGTRYMLLILGSEEMYFFDRDFRVTQLFNVKFLRRNSNESLTSTLLDGELVVDDVQGRKYPRYLIYDIVCLENEDVSKKNFRERLNLIYKNVFLPRENAKKTGLIDRSREPIGIRMKDFCELKDTYKYFTPKFQQVLSHEIDGLIFQPVNLGYIGGRCDKILKWKPPSHNSVDFHLKVVRETRPGMAEDYIGQLYVCNHERPFAYIKVTKTLKNYNNKIIECRFNMQKNCWEFMRERTDKSIPNGHKTAIGVCNSIRYPITKEDLLSFIVNRPFNSH